MKKGVSIGYLHEISDSRIFVLPGPLMALEIRALYYSLLMPANETLMHSTRLSGSGTRFRT
jgi:hypothetical protein